MIVLRWLRRTVGKDMFQYIYLPGILLVATSGLLFEQYYLLMQTSQYYWILTVSNWLLYALCFVSFYMSIRIDNRIPPVVPLPRARSQLMFNHEAYTEKGECYRQNNRYKPARTSHCHLQGCVARFDHHCPYIDNCLAYPNLKAFLLFIAYGGLFAFQFMCVSIVTYFQMTSRGSITYSEGAVIGWMILTICSFGLALAMLGMTFTTLAFIGKNITKIQVLKGTFKFINKNNEKPNPYDLGVVANFSTVLEGESWTWWLPTQIIPRADGTRFLMVPGVTASDIQTMPENILQRLRDPSQKEIPVSIEELYLKQRQKYRSTIFFFNGQQYSISQPSLEEKGEEVESEEIAEKREEESL